MRLFVEPPAPLLGQAVGQPEHAGAGMGRMVPDIAHDHRLAAAHHDALDGLPVAQGERMQAAHHLEGFPAELMRPIHARR